MKRHLIITLAICCQWYSVMAQAPEKFNYQAVARDASGNVLANQNITFRISILQGSETGTLAYAETHSKTTNTQGQVKIVVGAGTVISGSINGIAWGTNQYYLKTEMDPTGGNNFLNMGTTQLLSVPFALNAKKTESENFNYGDSIVLKDNQHVTRVIINPNTGTFKMMNNGEIWYSLSVQSPEKTVKKYNDRTVTTETTWHPVYGNVNVETTTWTNGTIEKRESYHTGSGTKDVKAQEYSLTQDGHLVRKEYSERGWEGGGYTNWKKTTEYTYWDNGNIKKEEEKKEYFDKQSNNVEWSTSIIKYYNENGSYIGNIYDYKSFDPVTKEIRIQDKKSTLNNDGSPRTDGTILHTIKNPGWTETKEYKEEGKMKIFSETEYLLSNLNTVNKFYNSSQQHVTTISDNLTTYQKVSSFINPQNTSIGTDVIQDAYGFNFRNYAAAYRLCIEPGWGMSGSNKGFSMNIKNGSGTSATGFSLDKSPTTDGAILNIGTDKLKVTSDEIEFDYGSNFTANGPASFNNGMTVMGGGTLIMNNLQVNGNTTFSSVNAGNINSSGTLTAQAATINNALSAFNINSTYGINCPGTTNLGTIETQIARVSGSLTVGTTQSAGEVQINGTLNVTGTKNFRIEYPGEPDKFLYHAAIESDLPLNQYSGIIITDKDGIAEVILPDYIEKINNNFRYHLTVIGEFAQAIIYKKIKNNRFVIKTDKPLVEVNWLLIGERNDAAIQEHPFMPVRDRKNEKKLTSQNELSI